MHRPFASVLLVTQLVLLSGPAVHSHAPEQGTASCDAMADHAQHLSGTADGQRGGPVAETPEDCEHCGVPACAAMVNCGASTVAAVAAQQQLAIANRESEQSVAPTLPPTSSSLSLTLPPPRA